MGSIDPIQLKTTTSNRLIVSGGGSRSDLMMQIVADVFARPAQRAGVPDAVALVVQAAIIVAAVFLQRQRQT